MVISIQWRAESWGLSNTTGILCTESNGYGLLLVRWTTAYLVGRITEDEV